MDSILEKLPLFDFLVKLKSGKCCIVSIAGYCGAGKTSFAKKLQDLLFVKNYKSQILHLDNFIKPSNKRDIYSTVYDYDMLRLEQEFLIPIKTIGKAKFALYDWKSDSLSQKTDFANDKIIIIEGVVSVTKSIKKYIDYSIFIKTDEQKRLQRVLQRGDFTLKEFKIWQKSEKEFFADIDIKEYFDLIVQN